MCVFAKSVCLCLCMCEKCGCNKCVFVSLLASVWEKYVFKKCVHVKSVGVCKCDCSCVCVN